jgi:hypothetical protein
MFVQSQRNTKRRRYDTTDEKVEVVPSSSSLSSSSTTSAGSKNIVIKENVLPTSPPPKTPYHRMICIGQAPGPTSITSSSLPPLPLTGLAGSRLAKLAGMTENDLWSRCDRLNIFQYYPGVKNISNVKKKNAKYKKHQSVGDQFNLHQAREIADTIDITCYHLVVLLGLNVAKAFRIQKPTLFARYYINSELNVIQLKDGESHDTMDATLILIFPHPSGVSHFWNSRRNRNRAMNELRLAMLNTGLIQNEKSKYFNKRRKCQKSIYFVKKKNNGEQKANKSGHSTGGGGGGGGGGGESI